jgi:hypothetical protein
VQEAGFEPLMTRAIADKQQWVADQAKAGVFKDVPKDVPKDAARDSTKLGGWQAYADALLASRKTS